MKKLIDIKSEPVMSYLELLLQDKTTGRNIIWGTDSYQELGIGFSDTDSMEKSILLEQADIIQPRIQKSLEVQQARTRKKAEVFTPAWLCNQMNNDNDAVWFGRSAVFNQEQEDHTWLLQEEKIIFPIKKYRKTPGWQRYVDSRRLEITCGEAPYLVSRYDASTGESIYPLKQRIGQLDRKLRIVNENTTDYETWMKWTCRAFEATYGYEYQGDNLLIARINLFLTFVEYYEERWGKKPDGKLLKKIANRIAWNLWQMDGLQNTTPIGKRVELYVQPSLFATEVENLEQGTLLALPCKVYNWRVNNSLLFGSRKRGKTMGKKLFDFVIGNPPYQLSDGGNNASAIPLYNKFIKGIVSQIQPTHLCLIIPSRWYSGGRGLDNFRSFMMNDSHIRELHDYRSANECFPGMDIPGGVCIFLRDSRYNGPCLVINKGKNSIGGTLKRYLNEFQIVIGDNQAVTILRKVVAKKRNALSEKVGTQRPFGLRTYARPTGQGDLLLKWNKGIGAIERKHVTMGMDMINKWKVIVSRVFYEHAGKAGKDGKYRVLSILDVLTPKTICTETYIVVDSFENKEEASDLKKYLQTKFSRFLILQASSSIMIAKSSFIFVPLQNFTSQSDIDWSQSIHDIDLQLYKKYGLDEKEIAFIESHVKEMG